MGMVQGKDGQWWGRWDVGAMGELKGTHELQKNDMKVQGSYNGVFDMGIHECGMSEA